MIRRLICYVRGHRWRPVTYGRKGFRTIHMVACLFCGSVKRGPMH